VRLGGFQDVTIRLIAERLLNTSSTASHASRNTECEPVYIGSATNAARADGQTGDMALATPPKLPAPRDLSSHHLYYSPEHNPGSHELVRELAAVVSPKSRPQMGKGRSSSSGSGHESPTGTAAGHKKRGPRMKRRRRLVELTATDDLHRLGRCESMLLYLNGQTWARPAAEIAQLTSEVSRAMHLGVRVILAHEAPGARARLHAIGSYS